MVQSKPRKLSVVFWIFITIYILNLLVPLFGTLKHTQRLWVTISISIGMIAIAILIKEKLPHKTVSIMGAILGILVGLSSLLTGIVTFFAFLASMRIMDKSEDRIALFKRPYFYSISLGLVMGSLLGYINLFLAGKTLEFAPSLQAFIIALNAGISEEIIYRLFIYALAIYILGGKIATRKDTLWVYILMIVPHVLMHFPDFYFVNGKFTIDLGSLVIGLVIQIVLFGLPMTFAMLKRDLTSSMIIHTLVDFFRFIFVDLPF